MLICVYFEDIYVLSCVVLCDQTFMEGLREFLCCYDDAPNGVYFSKPQFMVEKINRLRWKNYQYHLNLQKTIQKHQQVMDVMLQSLL